VVGGGKNLPVKKEGFQPKGKVRKGGEELYEEKAVREKEADLGWQQT